ncbi:MAG: polyprenyl synthetase family protein [Chlamydiae bacterium]|nr:polyprenyl synthetase family protein [Chlamydiota bacterium]
MGDKNELRDAVEFSLSSGGKRMRPIIVLMIADAINKNYDVKPAALSVEFFHTASLIADDLPCMDDDDKRRSKAALHKVFGEATALLASYTLIALGYEMICKNSKILKGKISNSDDVCTAALQIVSDSAGIKGATGGQFLDLNIKQIALKDIYKIIYQKTITLFEVAFGLGWIFGGGELDKLDIVKKCAYHFGMAFQIADDIDDVKQDEKKKFNINISSFVGKAEAKNLLKQHLDQTKEALQSLNLYNANFEYLIKLIEKLTS